MSHANPAGKPGTPATDGTDGTPTDGIGRVRNAPPAMRASVFASIAASSDYDYATLMRTVRWADLDTRQRQQALGRAGMLWSNQMLAIAIDAIGHGTGMQAVCSIVGMHIGMAAARHANPHGTAATLDATASMLAQAGQASSLPARYLRRQAGKAHEQAMQDVPAYTAHTAAIQDILLVQGEYDDLRAPGTIGDPARQAQVSARYQAMRDGLRHAIDAQGIDPAAFAGAQRQLAALLADGEAQRLADQPADPRWARITAGTRIDSRQLATLTGRYAHMFTDPDGAIQPISLQPVACADGTMRLGFTRHGNPGAGQPYQARKPWTASQLEQHLAAAVQRHYRDGSSPTATALGIPNDPAAFSPAAIQGVRIGVDDGLTFHQAQQASMNGIATGHLHAACDRLANAYGDAGIELAHMAMGLCQVQALHPAGNPAYAQRRLEERARQRLRDAHRDTGGEQLGQDIDDMLAICRHAIGTYRAASDGHAMAGACTRATGALDAWLAQHAGNGNADRLRRLQDTARTATRDGQDCWQESQAGEHPQDGQDAKPARQGKPVRHARTGRQARTGKPRPAHGTRQPPPAPTAGQDTECEP